MNIMKQHGMIFKNPYDMGWKKNLRRVFGDTPWYAALLISRLKSYASCFLYTSIDIYSYVIYARMCMHIIHM